MNLMCVYSHFDPLQATTQWAQKRPKRPLYDIGHMFNPHSLHTRFCCHDYGMISPGIKYVYIYVVAGFVIYANGITVLAPAYCDYKRLV